MTRSDQSSPFVPARGLAAAGLLLLALSSASPASAGLRDLQLDSEAPLRAWPARSAPAVEVLRPGSFVTLEGEVRAPWYRVRTTTGKLGWVAGRIDESRLVADEALAQRPTQLDGSARLLTPAELRSGPAPGRPVSAEMAAGTLVRVLDQWGTWVLLGDTQGRSGWAELSSFVAAEAQDPAPEPVREEARTARAEPPRAEPPRAEPPRAEPAEQAVEQDSGESEGPSGAELREQRIAERRAERERRREEARAAREAEQAEREARRAEQEERARLEKEREEAQRAAARRGEQEEAEEREAARLEQERARAEAEREEAERARAQAERRDAERAREEAARREARAQAEEPDEAESLDREARREAERREREEARAARRAEREAERAEREARKRAEREAKEAEKAAREAERAARRAERDDEPVEAEPRRAQRRESEPVEVQAMPSGPVQPAAIPAGLGVTLDGKAPAEKKPDPSRSPLLREPSTAGAVAELPVVDLGKERRAGEGSEELLEGFQPYDDGRQLERSVGSVHEKRGEAMDLSFAERPSARPSAFYVNESGETVDTRVVSEIVLRVGSEILTLSEFERRVDELREREQLRAGLSLSLDDARRRVLNDLVNDLLLLHQGRALGVRFDAVYESAKEEFKNKGGITDDLELLRLLDEMQMTFKDFRREMLRRTVPQIVIRTQVLGDVTVGDEEIENYYRRHQEEWEQQDCVLLSELVLQPEARETTRDFALRLEEILTRMEAGEDFCDLARRHSRSPSAAECGRLEDCFVFSQLDEKVARVVFQMRPGDVEPIRTDWGYHLLRVDEHRPRRVRTLEEVRDEIFRRLRGEKVQALIPRYLDDLRRSVRIEVAPAFRRYWTETRDGLGQ